MAGTSSYRDQTGPVQIRMTNDYLFRALMQKNKKVLKSLVGALLHLTEEEVTSVEIRNPVTLGEYIDNKEYILDLLVNVNDTTTLNIEMQVVNQHNWKERSLLYLCREFDHLNHGDEYVDVVPVIQVGMLDFSLDPKAPEFFATYQMMNVASHKPYTDKFQLKILELQQSGLATEEDKKWNLDKWAQFFKAQNWEEVSMLTTKLPVLGEAAETVWEMSADERIRRQCEAREEYYRQQRTMERLFEIQKEKLAVSERKWEESERKLAEKDKTLAEKDEKLARQEAEIRELRRLLDGKK